MPDLQSVPPLPGKETEIREAARWVDSNAAIQHALQSLETGDRRDIVLRCDELPYLHGNPGEIDEVFSAILQMILQKKAAVARLFLHISCRNSHLALPAVPGGMLYSIQFGTNITPCTDWMREQEKTMARVLALVQKNHGIFEMAQMTSQGCVFCVSLPGKPF